MTIGSIVRHWVLIDLAVLRPWLTDTRIRHAELIDNKDGTYGVAFDLRWLEGEAFVAMSDTMRVALEQGMAAVPLLPTGPPRVLRPAPNLQDLVARHGGYDRIPSEAMAKFQADTRNWMEDVRMGRAEVIASTKDQADDAARRRLRRR